MAHPYHHALSSVKRWGGQVEDYMAIHDWFDQSKQHLADVRHRALRHHAEGIFLCEQVFGKTITNTSGKVVPVRWVGEQHVNEDLGWIPSVKDWLQHLQLAPWMCKAGVLPISEEERSKGELTHEQEKHPSQDEHDGAEAAKGRKGKRPADERSGGDGHQQQGRRRKPAGARGLPGR